MVRQEVLTCESRGAASEGKENIFSALPNLDQES